MPENVPVMSETVSNSSSFTLRLVPVKNEKISNKMPVEKPPVYNLPDNDEIRRNKTFVVARIED